MKAKEKYESPSIKTRAITTESALLLGSATNTMNTGGVRYGYGTLDDDTELDWD